MNDQEQHLEELRWMRQDAISALKRAIEEQAKLALEANEIQDKIFQRWMEDPYKQFWDETYRHWKQAENTSDRMSAGLSHFQESLLVLDIHYPEYRKEVEEAWLSYQKKNCERPGRKDLPPRLMRQQSLRWLLDLASGIVKSRHLSVLEKLLEM